MNAAVSIKTKALMINEYGSIGGMRIGMGNQITKRKCIPEPLPPPQTPHDLTYDQTWATMVGSRQLIA
jgi:hypothetical protein